MLVYDEEKEQQFYELCKLDENPVVCTDPVEASSYLSIKYYFSPEGYQSKIQVVYNQYQEYLDQFIQQNSVEINGQTYLRLTIVRLVSKYQNLLTQFKNSSVRLDWKLLASSYTLQNPHDDFNIEKQQKYTREAYRYFYKMAATQMLFIEMIIQNLSLQNSTFINTDGLKANQIYITNISNIPRFALNDKIINSIVILEYIYDRLMTENYIKSTRTEFLKLFNKSDEPIKPITWRKPYNYLSYFVHLMSAKIIQKQTNPSEYEIAINLFCNNDGVRFSPKRNRHDTDPKKSAKEIIEKMVHSVEKMIKS